MMNLKHFIHKQTLGRYEYMKKFKKIGITYDEFYSYKYVGTSDNITTFATSKIFGIAIRRIGNYSFVQNVEEVLFEEVYKFNSSNSRPVIIDCGANIGLSLIYFKRLYPNSEITAFEPDINIFNVCKENIDSFKFTDIELINAAVWKNDEELHFISDNSLGGKIDNAHNSSVESNKVKAVRLSNYLNREIDFLKIDIEGSELEVLEDCKNKLHNVRNLFIEYHSDSKQNQNLQRLLEIMSDAHFRYYIKPAYDYMKHPFVDYENNNELSFDLQLNIFAYKK